MRKRKRFLATLMGVAVVGLSAYVGYRTYDAYVEKTLENDLLLENAEALANGSNEGVKNTGPASYHRCSGLFSGKGKYCDCVNSNPCEEHPCN